MEVKSSMTANTESQVEPSENNTDAENIWVAADDHGIIMTDGGRDLDNIEEVAREAADDNGVNIRIIDHHSGQTTVAYTTMPAATEYAQEGEDLQVVGIVHDDGSAGVSKATGNGNQQGWNLGSETIYDDWQEAIQSAARKCSDSQ